MMSKRTRWRLLSSGLIVVLTAIGAAVMFTKRNESILTAHGLQNLKYFTVDSNLFLSLACLAELVFAAAERAGRTDRDPPWLDTVIYAATVSVALTFTVVVLLFGPGIGYAPLFRGANLFFHLIIPVLAVAFFCTLRRDRQIPLGETALALIPPALYGAYYTAVLLLHGVHFPETDWYGFGSGGTARSVFTAAVILLLTWLLALLIRLLSGGRKCRARRGRSFRRSQSRGTGQSRRVRNARSPESAAPVAALPRPQSHSRSQRRGGRRN